MYAKNSGSLLKKSVNSGKNRKMLAKSKKVEKAEYGEKVEKFSINQKIVKQG